MDTHSGGGNSISLFCFFIPSEKGSTLKGKNLLPLGANSFLLGQTPFQKSPGVKESKEEDIKFGFPLTIT